MKDEKHGFSSPTLTYGSRGWESNRPYPKNYESPVQNEEIELHTFNDWHSIEADPTIDISVFIDPAFIEQGETEDNHKKR